MSLEHPRIVFVSLCANRNGGRRAIWKKLTWHLVALQYLAGRAPLQAAFPNQSTLSAHWRPRPTSSLITIPTNSELRTPTPGQSSVCYIECDPGRLPAVSSLKINEQSNDSLENDGDSASWWSLSSFVSSFMSIFVSVPSLHITPSLNEIVDDTTHLEALSRDEETSDPRSWTEPEREQRTIPQYVLDYAPYVHLFSGEEFWPCDMVDHLQHVKPYFDQKPLDGARDRYDLTNLHELNDYHKDIFLTSDDNVEERPEWLSGESNIPEEPTGNDPIGGRSEAPAVVIVVHKENGVVDAFFHYFYCYNLGNKVFNIRFGDHVGDWEHMVVRFQYGKPKQVWFSEHVFGQAFEYDALEKIGRRAVGYSAVGTHAMYATPAIHRYILPFGLLHDQTDRGPLWDPIRNMHSYMYNMTERKLRSSNLTPDSPTEWFYFTGQWGDKAYPSNDRRQYYFAGQSHYVDGPSGPIHKSLGRTEVCMGMKECKVKKSLEGADRIRKWPDGAQISRAEERLVLERYREARSWDDDYEL